MWQKEEQRNGLKTLNEQSLVNGLNLDVDIATRKVKINHRIIKENKGIIAQINAMQEIGEKIGNQKNRQVGVAELLHTKAIVNGLRKILNEWLISKQDVTPEKETQKVRIPWKNGRVSKRYLGIGVPNAERLNRLRKTISNLYPPVEATTSQISNLFAGLVIVVSGSFNIHENPELLTDSTL